MRIGDLVKGMGLNAEMLKHALPDALAAIEPEQIEREGHEWLKKLSVPQLAALEAVVKAEVAGRGLDDVYAEAAKMLGGA